MSTRSPRSLVTMQSVAAFLVLAWPLLAAEPFNVTRDSAGTFYKGFKRLTDEPHKMSSLMIVGCRGPTPAENEKDRATFGPHAQAWVHYYANESAAQAIAGKAMEFPVGAVIVKEKLGDKKAITGVAGMIKRASGYDAGNGDWEFFFHTPGGEFSSGKLTHCIDCHNGAGRDHVFVAWKISSSGAAASFERYPDGRTR